jgi:hypothetical protein
VTPQDKELLMLNTVERQSSEKHGMVENIGVLAELTQDISFIRWDGVPVFISKGTTIHVDEQNERGSFLEYYFDIATDEYRILFPN